MHIVTALTTAAFQLLTGILGLVAMGMADRLDGIARHQHAFGRNGPGSGFGKPSAKGSDSVTSRSVRFYLGRRICHSVGWSCLDGWGGLLPQEWIDRHIVLQKNILARERSLGMTPVLQGFTGHVPVGLMEKFPQGKFQTGAKMGGFSGYDVCRPAGSFVH